ncbi:MAG: RidA family protein [Deltaproteobacteria bacterium]|nr:RidA family protein [Deltaproteobacteria bacterium]MBI3079026.1 RidA family protein [Deltaproteobacteria bacterium]
MEKIILKPKAVGEPIGAYSHAFKFTARQWIAVAGQVGLDGQGRLAGPDIKTQTRQAFENVRAVLEAGGATFANVVKFMTFLRNEADIPGFMEARNELFPRYFPDKAYPPNTLLVVKRLVRDELLVEIEALAALD